MANGHVKRGDVARFDLTGATGAEIEKVRPCVVVQNDTGNKFAPTTIIVPLTDAGGPKPLPTHVVVPAAELGPGGKDSVAKCEQVRTVDCTVRLKGVVASLSPARMAQIDAALRISLGL